jgi:peroxiredoxin
MRAFQRDLNLFEELTTQVLGVSPDSPTVHEEFSTKYGITFS